MLCNECAHFNVCKFSDDANRAMELVAKVSDTPNPILLDLRCDASADPGLDEWCTDCAEYDQERRCCPRFNRVIRETLADMKQKTGKWVPDPDRDGYGRYICSECEEPFEVKERMGKPLWKFCPMCGARMDDEQNERHCI